MDLIDSIYNKNIKNNLMKKKNNKNNNNNILQNKKIFYLYLTTQYIFIFIQLFLKVHYYYSLHEKRNHKINHGN